MPALTRWSVKAAIVWLVVALLLGVATASPATLGLSSDWSRLGPLYWHFLAVGWATQLIFGVAYWMFPVLSREHPYRSPRLAWVMFGLLNLGLLARLLAEGLPVAMGRAPNGWLYLVSAVAQFLAACAFVANTWSRVRQR